MACAPTPMDGDPQVIDSVPVEQREDTTCGEGSAKKEIYAQKAHVHVQMKVVTLRFFRARRDGAQRPLKGHVFVSLGHMI